MAPRNDSKRRARAARFPFDTNSFLAALGPLLPELSLVGLLVGLVACGHDAPVHTAPVHTERGPVRSPSWGAANPLDAGAGATGTADGAGRAQALLADAPPSRAATLARELLEVAIVAAGAPPRMPHGKTRARLQEQVVLAAIDLGELGLAERWARDIEGWRRGKVLADVSLALARREDRTGARRVLDDAIAEERALAAAGELDPSAQAWQRDRVRAAIAVAGAALGAADEAARFGVNLADSELGTLAAARAGELSSEELDAELARLDLDIAARSFERASAALEALIVLHGRFAAEGEERAAIERRIDEACRSVPARVEIDVCGRLADAALARGAADRAQPWIERAQRAFDRTTWEPALRLPARARLAALRFGAGEQTRAREELAAAAKEFDAERASVVDIDRADALIPLAEAWLAARRPEEARAVWARAFDEGSANPNSRPRAEDLVAACLSIARRSSALEPGDDALLARAKRALAALTAPW